MKRKPLRLDEYGIESLLVRAQKWLYNYEPQRVWYPQELYGKSLSAGDFVESFKDACESNRNSFIQELQNNNNMYAIWTESRPYSKLWDLKYIGQRHSTGIKDRLRNHLFGAPFGEGKKPKSKFKNIIDSLNSGKMIYVSYVQVSPESLRTFIEHSLICINKKRAKLCGTVMVLKILTEIYKSYKPQV
ncbi:hypothetical protein [Thalassotalea euphylliae]|uniref:Uncharacterized protein n=1 Tax=Thalassotalea euphylliae TaxID=1655234 RepID=A0A3E0UF45_9GAMM|nr:hypothetical protein [Thalassotalea euphylliae]REL35177.1 hypothetical protein DXX92_07295 [Thalassotalea euphylliae]